jgi:hypothetical protein
MEGDLIILKILCPLSFLAGVMCIIAYFFAEKKDRGLLTGGIVNLGFGILMLFWIVIAPVLGPRTVSISELVDKPTVDSTQELPITSDVLSLTYTVAPPAVTPMSTLLATSVATTLAIDEWMGEPYTDPRGYFIITPPQGWDTLDYPSESRGKVAFSTTEGDQLVEIRVLVQVTQVTDFQEFVKKLKANVANLGLQAEWQVMEFSDMPAIRSIMTYSGNGVTRKILNLRFLDGNIYHDIQFSSDPALFDKYQDVVAKVVAGYEIVKRPDKGDDSATAKQQQAEKYLVLAKAALEIGEKTSAAAFVEEGLKNDPENKDLLSLKESLQP